MCIESQVTDTLSLGKGGWERSTAINLKGQARRGKGHPVEFIGSNGHSQRISRGGLYKLVL